MEAEQNYQNNSEHIAQVMTTGDWLIFLLLMSIPVLNIIMLVVWAANQKVNPNRKNIALAALLFMLITIIFGIIFIISVAGDFATALSSAI